MAFIQAIWHGSCLMDEEGELSWVSSVKLNWLSPASLVKVISGFLEDSRFEKDQQKQFKTKISFSTFEKSFFVFDLIFSFKRIRFSSFFQSVKWSFFSFVILFSYQRFIFSENNNDINNNSNENDNNNSNNNDDNTTTNNNSKEKPPSKVSSRMSRQ